MTHLPDRSPPEFAPPEANRSDSVTAPSGPDAKEAEMEIRTY